MQNPADLQKALFTVNSNGAANTTTTAVAVAAPGLTSRIRVWGAHFGSTATRTASQMLVIIEGAGATNQVAYLNTQLGGDSDFWISGGFALQPNEQLNYVTQANAATQPVRLTIFYTIEKVA